MSAPSIAGNLKSPYFPQIIQEDEGFNWKPRSQLGEKNKDENSEEDEDDEEEEEETSAEIQSLLMPLRRYDNW